MKMERMLIINKSTRYTIRKVLLQKSKLKLKSAIAGGYAISLHEVTDNAQTKKLKNYKVKRIIGLHFLVWKVIQF